ncbi:glutathione S-transferase N-terminal domain-containing protein [uncultured Phenylobacterium sp.]|uniref:glutathione S-transferase N-terminal domain-containing protein n=1 Tax=uncultured Phenylobacterium sp. TaxID=349273 RepID=UPI0025DF3A07|nr:glutathione S-transferase N-terminal domain-containing protein [uncultured Phenylobacterium sp.]
MDLYFAPLSCSLATRIAIYEAGLPARFHQVTLSTKTLADGQDYLAVNPKGQVPALRTDGGEILTEGPAILQYVADLAPDSGLAPVAGELDRYRLQQWLNYIATEVHKGIFYTLFNPATPVEAKGFARDALLPPRYAYLSAHLAEREHLLDGFTVADAYLFTTLNWAAPAGVDLSDWPVLQAYRERLLGRPAVARAVSEEAALR